MQHRWSVRHGRLAAIVILACLGWTLCATSTSPTSSTSPNQWFAAPVALAQGVEPDGRPVHSIEVVGLRQVPLALVENQIRLQPGQPYDPALVQQDIVRLTHLGRFDTVSVRFEQRDDGSLAVYYVVQEQPLLSDVQVSGNKKLNDQDLLSKVLLRAGDPADPFLIEQGIQRIEEAYQEAGYLATSVAYDEELLRENGILIYEVREGLSPRVRRVVFEGNEVFTDKQLKSKVQTNTYILLFRKGELNRERVRVDASLIRDFYRQQGYLDAQCGGEISISDNFEDAQITFHIEEGRRYTVRSIEVEGNEVFSDEDILSEIPLKVGDVYTLEREQDSAQRVLNLYGKLGFISTQLRKTDRTSGIDRLFIRDSAQVDAVIRIEEGIATTVGRVTIQGNSQTKDSVILRQTRGLEPGRPFDGVGLRLTERRLAQSTLFSEADVTVLGEPEDVIRDVLIEVEEQNTGRLSFGAGINSDAGVAGQISLEQSNFDIADFPETFREFLTGRAFRGAGQFFSIVLQPGDEFSRYSVSFREPYLLDSNFFLSTSSYFYNDLREDWDEQRYGGSVGFGKRFGDIWSAQIRVGGENVEISDLDADAPVDAFAVGGNNFLTELGLILTRNTTDSRLFPTQGSIVSAGISRTGALGGDFDFTRVTADMRKFWTVDEDFFERKTVLSTRLEIGVILEEDEAPLFERFNAGGHRTFRGFEFRGIGPRGIRNDTGTRGDDPVGGDWLFLFGVEYNFPVFQDILRMVLFTDTGTVQDDIGLDEYRVSIGAGVRIKIPFLGEAPFALDLAYPLIKEEDDEEQFFSFSLDVPF